MMMMRTQCVPALAVKVLAPRHDSAVLISVARVCVCNNNRASVNESSLAAAASITSSGQPMPMHTLNKLS